MLCSDIQYKEGILEYLEEKQNVDYIILNESLEGEIEVQELINLIRKKVKNVKIIIVSNENIDEEKIIKKLKNEEKKIKPEIKQKIIKKYNETENKFNKEIEKLKKEESNYRNKKSIFSQKTLPINNIFYSQKNNQSENNENVVCILGPNGIGKSVFSILLAQSMENKKCVIIDFDILNQSLHTMLGVKKYKEKIKKGISKNDLINHNQDFEKYIIKTKMNIDLLSGMNLILDAKYKLSSKKIVNIIKKLKEKYDVIIFDTSPENFMDYTKELIFLSNKIIFISGANLLEVKKSEKLLEIYTKEWGVSKNKINIVFNRCTNKSIDTDILREIFNRYTILGKIQLNDYYDLVINKNMSQKSKIRKEIENIKKKIIKEKYYGIS